MMRLSPALFSALALAACASAQATRPSADELSRLPDDPTTAVAVKDPEVPTALRPADGSRQLLQVHAVGVQIYECAQGANSAWEWKFRGPEAALFDARGAKIGDHGAGPFWRLADGSRIVGQAKASVPAPTTGAIPWLLLTVTSRTGSGALDPVDAVQRINTVGGVAPAPAACTTAASGRIERVGYTADYLFWAVAPSR
ncbi:DUF3455 domain-containing protein [Roseateles chitinivorans]|uniref:DUF3455 domain-containing protein n=1 Tax=Roseateles chitinivorans TaxID=2917965 RepID=UPI003D67B9E0